MALRTVGVAMTTQERVIPPFLFSGTQGPRLIVTLPPLEIDAPNARHRALLTPVSGKRSLSPAACGGGCSHEDRP
jgi:hypothetical protein